MALGERRGARVGEEGERELAGAAVGADEDVAHSKGRERVFDALGWVGVWCNEDLKSMAVSVVAHAS